MSHYSHLTTSERECILVLLAKNYSIRQIANSIERDPSTISRELKRNNVQYTSPLDYSPSQATNNYHLRRKNCKRHCLLDNPQLHQLVLRLFHEQQWSPEQISNRLKLENSSFSISYNTIYRAIYLGKLEIQPLSHGQRGAARKLRHRGKTRHKKGHVETRGKITISHPLEERPAEANERSCIGHVEIDTVAGKTGGECMLTIVDRCSRYLIGKKIEKKTALNVEAALLEIIRELPAETIKSITPDRGKEFAAHERITATTGIEFYFPPPHAPWLRGSNENTNGLLREYMPKSQDMAAYSEDDVAEFIYKLNTRPRKCLGWRSPHEIFFNTVLHLT